MCIFLKAKVVLINSRCWDRSDQHSTSLKIMLTFFLLKVKWRRKIALFLKAIPVALKIKCNMKSFCFTFTGIFHLGFWYPVFKKKNLPFCSPIMFNQPCEIVKRLQNDCGWQDLVYHDQSDFSIGFSNICSWILNKLAWNSRWRTRHMLRLPRLRNTILDNGSVQTKP